MRSPTSCIGVVLCLALPRAAQGQEWGVHGYSLNVATVQAAGELGPALATDLQRLRLLAAPRIGRLALDVAYEHTLLWRDHDDAGMSTVIAASASRSRPDLDWSVLSRDRVEWRHRFDRLAADFSSSRVQLTVGRQAISWATTLFLTPADPFAPFDPADPFREYRAGVDAARLQLFPGPFSTVDVVVERSTAGATALARGKRAFGAWSLSAWAGSLRGRPAVAAAAEGAIGAWAIRAEAETRRPWQSGTALRAATGIDRRFSVAGRDLYVLFEAQHDELGASRPTRFGEVVTSGPYARGELQLLSRDAVAAQATWQVHPLVSAELLGLLSLNDGSALVAPALAASLSDEASLRLGAFLGAGRGGLTEAALPRSEFGTLPAFGYLALSAFF